MAWALRASATVASNAANPGASRNCGNLGAATVLGDRIILAIDASMVSAQPHVTGVTSTGGGTIKWARDFVIEASHNGYFEHLSVWSGVCLASGSVTAVTAALSPSLSASSGISCAGAAFSGLASGFGLGVDQSGEQDLVCGGFADTTPNTTYDSKTTLVAPNKPNLLIIGAHGDAGATTTLTKGATYTLAVKTDANGNGQCLLQYMDSGTAGTPLRSTCTGSGSAFDMSAVVAYRILAGNTPFMARRPAITRPGRARYNLRGW
jgi:hypothetical protein